MPFVLADRVKDTTTTTGTGTITLSGTAPIGYVSFGTAIGNGNNTYYTITAGSEWEVGIGTYTAAGTTLSRDTVLASSAGGTTKVTFSAGTKDVFVTYPAGRSVFLDTAGGITVGNSLLTLSSAGAVTSPNLADATGYKGIPQNSQTSAYTLALSDMGKHISITTGGVVIPANASVAFPIGSAVTIFNNSGSNQTISITTDTLRQAGTSNTGSRTLAQYGVATVLKVTSTVWVISGAGIS